jgi:hypothetical protein
VFTYLLLFLIFLSLLEARVVSADIKDDAYSSIQNAEEVASTTFLAIASAEKAGADIHNLTLNYNLALNFLSNATRLYEKGEYTQAVELINSFSLITSNIITEADQLKVSAILKKGQSLNLAMITGIVSSAAICLIGIYAWRHYSTSYRNDSQKLENLGAFLILFCLLLGTVSFWPLIVSVYPVQSGEESFLALGLLGNKQMLGDYYPKNRYNITTGTIVQWYIYTHNHMKSVQYVEVRVKLANSTNLFPDSQNLLSSSASTFFRSRFILQDEEERYIPFNWTINKLKIENNITSVNELKVNEIPINSTVTTSNNDLYIIVELWVYNEKSDSFEFKWEANQKYYCVWNVIWFRAVPSRTPRYH